MVDYWRKQSDSNWRFRLPKNSIFFSSTKCTGDIFRFRRSAFTFLKTVSNRLDMREAIVDYAVLSLLRYRGSQCDSNWRFWFPKKSIFFNSTKCTGDIFRFRRSAFTFLKAVSNRLDMREAVVDYAVLRLLRYRGNKSDS